MNIEQTTSGISINGTALQTGDATKVGLMTPAVVTKVNDALPKSGGTLTGILYTEAPTPFLIGNNGKVGLRATKAGVATVCGQINISDSWYGNNQYGTQMNAYNGVTGKHNAFRISHEGPVYYDEADAPHPMALKEEVTAVADDVDDITTALATAFSDIAITESATEVSVQLSKVDGMTTITESIPSATPTTAGVMSAEDKAKLDSLRPYNNNKFMVCEMSSGDSAFRITGDVLHSSSKPYENLGIAYMKYIDAYYSRKFNAIIYSTLNGYKSFIVKYETASKQALGAVNWYTSGTFTIENGLPITIVNINGEDYTTETVDLSSFNKAKFIYTNPKFANEPSKIYTWENMPVIELDIVNGTWTSTKPLANGPIYQANLVILEME